MAAAASLGLGIKTEVFSLGTGTLYILSACLETFGAFLSDSFIIVDELLENKTFQEYKTIFSVLHTLKLLTCTHPLLYEDRKLFYLHYPKFYNFLNFF